jgi:hypothetical protein
MYTGTYKISHVNMVADRDNNSILGIHVEMHMLTDIQQTNIISLIFHNCLQSCSRMR